MPQIKGVVGVCLLALLLLAGCGGSSSTATGAGGGSPVGADFTLSVTPTSVSLAPGSSQTLEISYDGSRHCKDKESELLNVLRILTTKALVDRVFLTTPARPIVRSASLQGLIPPLPRSSRFYATGS